MEITVREGWYWKPIWVIEDEDEILYSFTTQKAAIETALLIQKVVKGVFHTDMSIRIRED